ncbi:hypothetical protein BDW22DRAFT_1410606 [Trametopsis cervina]|nr:hypothetical protein BDW22DRAFT_1410606 [Trametopsis cervina]
MATPDRQELLRNAITFLRDPKTQSSPLAQRVQFLEAKGLTGAEIEEAMRQSTVAAVTATPYVSAPYQVPYGPMAYAAQAPAPWDWRDYFITAVVSGTIAYGAAALYRKFVLPHLRPPSATAYEEDRDALTAQFDAAEALLKEIQAETSAMRTAVEEQRERIDKTTDEVDAVMKDMKESETQTRAELASIREEVNNVRDMLPRMIERNKENHTQSLGELRQEIKSLKTLLLNRGGSVTPSGLSTPILPGKPSIPAWQLAGANSTSSAPTTSLPNTPSASNGLPPSAPPTPPPFGKGKEVESPIVQIDSAQWRHAVENLAQHSPKPSQDAAVTDESAPRASTDSTASRIPPSSSQLAEAAISNLRKPDSPAMPTVTPATSRTTLEDRLRAKFSAKGSPSSTPVPVFDHPLSPVPPEQQPEVVSDESSHPLSPSAIPLPDSPAIDSSIYSPIPLSAIIDQPLSSPPDDDLVPISNTVGEETTGNADLSSEAIIAVPEAVSVEGSGHRQDEKAIANEETEDEPSAGIPQSPPLPPDQIYPEETVVQQATTADEVIEAAEVASTEETQLRSSDSGEVLEDEDASLELTSSPLPKATEEPIPGSPDVTANSHSTEITGDQRNVSSRTTDEVDVEALQERLKLIEQRFSDVSTSFKRLQAEKAAVDRVLQETTSVQTIQEADALRDFLQNMNLKTEMAQDEIKRLSGKLIRQDERIEELRDIHRLESKSQSDLIDKLRSQLKANEDLLKAAENSSKHAEEQSSKHQSELNKLHVEAEKMKAAAKDEEEKRVKAVSLLKTVRQKLVKAEKDRDDALKDLQTVKDHEKEEREKDRLERLKLHDEIEKVNAERETAVQGLKIQFDKEIAGLKERQDKELLALRGQYELEVITLKSLHSKEIENKSGRISDLEASLQIVSREKDDIFDQLQMRQAELESSQSHLESLQSQTVELQHQLREATDRAALLNEELMEANRAQVAKVQSSAPSAEVTQLLSATEAKYEARIADLRRQIIAAERERDETEADLSKKVTEKVKEVEHIKAILGRSAKAREEEEETISALKKEIDGLRHAGVAYERVIADLQTQTEKATEVESTAQAQIAEVRASLAAIEKQLEESKAKEAQARTTNKTLREELRKVQSSAALLERQRNPGVGYWASKSESTTELRSPTSSTSDLPKEAGRPESPASVRSDEEVNYEYLRNVILQFLEHKEMRPHLIRILSTILRFTPQETRRLIAKV